MSTYLSGQSTPEMDISRAQRERLAYIDFRLCFLGDVRRTDLIHRFEIAPAAATRDFAFYKAHWPRNLAFDMASKTYVVSQDFRPAFDHDAERALTALSKGFGDGLGPVTGPLVPCELPMALNRPPLAVLAVISRAIHQRKTVRINYTSHSSGPSEREIAPFALASDGLRWHARAFDRKRQGFRDFVLSRVSEPHLIDDGGPVAREGPEHDIQWNRVVELVLVPHPNRRHAEITKQDFAMGGDELHVKIRAALAGYVLRQWHVDCSPDHSLTDEAYRLWLRDPLKLYDVESAPLAPGYLPPVEARSSPN